MPNGEYRFRMMANDGSGCIMTVAGEQSEWQNAHYHRGVMETYVVQSGWMGFAERDGYDFNVSMYHKGQTITSNPLNEHNVYLPVGTVIYTVKHGIEIPNPEKGADWYPATEAFDTWSKGLSEDQIRYPKPQE